MSVKLFRGYNLMHAFHVKYMKLISPFYNESPTVKIEWIHNV